MTDHCTSFDSQDDVEGFFFVPGAVVRAFIEANAYRPGMFGGPAPYCTTWQNTGPLSSPPSGGSPSQPKL